jgi:sugar phosphate permease
MLGTVNGIYSSGVYLGGALASLSILIDNRLGWKSTLLVIAGCGCIVSLLMGTLIREPEVQKKSSTSTLPPSSPPAGLAASMQSVLSPLEVKLLLSASVLRFCAGFTIGIWKAPFVFAKFAGNENAFAGSNAFIVAVGGLLSSLLGGYLSDLISSPDKNKNPTGKVRARAWVPAIGSALAAPAWALFVLSDKPEWAVGFLFAEYLVAECWFGPTLAAISGAVPASSRGAANGLFSIATALGNLAPVIVGAFAGGVAGNYPLGDVLIASVSGSYVLCSILFAAAALEHDRRLEREEKL